MLCAACIKKKIWLSDQHDFHLPDIYSHKFRSWCPDRTIAQARSYIGDSMGARYADAVLLDLEGTWAESDPRTPLICFLSMGSDPTNQIEGLCKKVHLECRAISMGQGQEVHARRLVGQFMQTVSILDHIAFVLVSHFELQD